VDEKRLRKHFEAHAAREQRKAQKMITKIRRASESKPPREKLDPRSASDASFDDEPVALARSRPVRDVSPIGLSRGTVIEVGAGFCDVLAGERLVRCRAGLDLAPGDEALFSEQKRRIESALPRRTVLSRSDPHNPRLERVIAANIDMVVNVVSLKSPPLRPGLIDRYLIAIGKSGAQPLICVNKLDLLGSDADLEPLTPYRAAGIPVIACSASTGAGIGQLSEALAGKVCVLSGHSGVGKSSLLNALDSRLRLATGAVSAGNAKGRHTTTSSSLHRLANGAAIIDTPGIREFGLWNIGAAEVRNFFQEFEQHSPDCPFRDCSHTHEPDCAVKSAVERGEVQPVRYSAYRRVLESL
jgi:ribosome biogenesis GTPase